MKQRFQAVVGMFPRRASWTKLLDPDASAVLQPAAVHRASQIALGPVPETVLKGILSSGQRIPSIHWEEEAELL